MSLGETCRRAGARLYLVTLLRCVFVRLWALVQAHKLDCGVLGASSTAIKLRIPRSMLLGPATLQLKALLQKQILHILERIELFIFQQYREE